MSSKHNSGGVPSGPGTLLVCQSAMPKHLKGKKNKKVSLGLGPMVYLVLFHFEFCQILRGRGAILSQERILATAKKSPNFGRPLPNKLIHFKIIQHSWI